MLLVIVSVFKLLNSGLNNFINPFGNYNINLIHIFTSKKMLLLNSSSARYANQTIIFLQILLFRLKILCMEMSNFKNTSTFK